MCSGRARGDSRVIDMVPRTTHPPSGGPVLGRGGDQMASISARTGAVAAGAIAVAGLATRWVRCRFDRPQQPGGVTPFVGDQPPTPKHIGEPPTPTR